MADISSFNIFIFLLLLPCKLQKNVFLFAIRYYCSFQRKLDTFILISPVEATLPTPLFIA